MAVDAFGREIVMLSRTQLTQDLFAAFYNPNANANSIDMYIWITYDQQLVQLSGDACTRQNTSNPYSRVRENFRLLVTSTPTPVPAINDPLIIDGNAMTPPAGPPPSPVPTPAPGEINLPYDGSVPYQEFQQDDTTVHWYIPLGQVLWHPHLQVFVQTGSTALGRQYCGAVAAAIEAPNAQLVIQDRMTPSPLSDNPTYPGVAVEVQGSLTVDRLLTAEDDVYLIEHGHLNFKKWDGTDGDTELWIRRITNPTGGADLHIHIGDNSDPAKKPQRLTVANGPPGDESKEQIVFDVRADGNVDIPIGALNFASQTRQMINLWSTGYGIGVQNSTEYFRTDGIFCWFRQGKHSDTKADPGSGGTLAMKLDESSTLTVAGNAIVNGSVGIGTAVPVSKLQIAGDITLEKISGGLPRMLPASGTLLWNDGTWLRLNQNLDFSKPIFGVHTPGLFAPGSLNVGGGASWGDPGFGNAWITGTLGVGTAAPAAQLHVNGNRIRLEGAGKRLDLRTDGSAVDLQSETSNLYLRSSGPGPNNNLILNPFSGDGNVGIGTQTPAFKLDVAGVAHATSFPTSSDDRLKCGIVRLEGVLEKLQEIRGVSFEWNEKYAALGRSSGKRELGVLAQEVAAVFPELVTKWGDENYLAVDYGRLTAVLVEAIKELIDQNETMARRLGALERHRSKPSKKGKE
jgi:hypothetical protein